MFGLALCLQVLCWVVLRCRPGSRVELELYSPGRGLGAEFSVELELELRLVAHGLDQRSIAWPSHQ